VWEHTLRRTFGTWCVINGMTLEHVRALYGHADLKTTMQHLYLTEQNLLDASQKHNPL
jgi:site-specific recombinase XerD